MRWKHLLHVSGVERRYSEYTTDIDYIAMAWTLDFALEGALVSGLAMEHPVDHRRAIVGHGTCRDGGDQLRLAVNDYDQHSRRPRARGGPSYPWPPPPPSKPLSRAPSNAISNTTGASPA